MKCIALRALGPASLDAQDFVADLGRHADLDSGATDTACDAVLLLDPPETQAVSPTDETPLAIWCRDEAAARRTARRLPDVACIIHPGVASPGRDSVGRIVAYPSPGVDAGQSLWIAPFLRQRRRQALGITASPILDLTDTATALDLDAVAVTTVGIAQSARALLLLATGVPLVTDAATADLLTLTPDHDAVVAEPPQWQEAAQRLSRDGSLCARLAVWGRRRVEQSHSTSPALDRFLNALGMSTRPTVAERPMAVALASLGTAALTPALERLVLGYARLDRR